MTHGGRKPKLSLDMTPDIFDRLVTAMLRNMFLSGACIGSSMAGLFFLGAYTTLSVLIGAGVIWIAYRGWPWELPQGDQKDGR